MPGNSNPVKKAGGHSPRSLSVAAFISTVTDFKAQQAHGNHSGPSRGKKVTHAMVFFILLTRQRIPVKQYELYTGHSAP